MSNCIIVFASNTDYLDLLLKLHYTTVAREIIKILIDQIAEKEGHHTEVEVSMDKVIEEDHIMSITIEMITEKIILGICKIIEVKILEVDTEGII